MKTLYKQLEGDISSRGCRVVSYGKDIEALYKFVKILGKTVLEDLPTSDLLNYKIFEEELETLIKHMERK